MLVGAWEQVTRSACARKAAGSQPSSQHIHAQRTQRRRRPLASASAHASPASPSPAAPQAAAPASHHQQDHIDAPDAALPKSPELAAQLDFEYTAYALRKPEGQRKKLSKSGRPQKKKKQRGGLASLAEEERDFWMFEAMKGNASIPSLLYDDEEEGTSSLRTGGRAPSAPTAASSSAAASSQDAADPEPTYLGELVPALEPPASLAPQVQQQQQQQQQQQNSGPDQQLSPLPHPRGWAPSVTPAHQSFHTPSQAPQQPPSHQHSAATSALRPSTQPPSKQSAAPHQQASGSRRFPHSAGRQQQQELSLSGPQPLEAASSSSHGSSHIHAGHGSPHVLFHQQAHTHPRQPRRYQRMIGGNTAPTPPQLSPQVPAQHERQHEQQQHHQQQGHTQPPPPPPQPLQGGREFSAAPAAARHRHSRPPQQQQQQQQQQHVRDAFTQEALQHCETAGRCLGLSGPKLTKRPGLRGVLLQLHPPELASVRFKELQAVLDVRYRVVLRIVSEHPQLLLLPEGYAAVRAAGLGEFLGLESQKETSALLRSQPNLLACPSPPEESMCALAHALVPPLELAELAGLLTTHPGLLAHPRGAAAGHSNACAVVQVLEDQLGLTKEDAVRGVIAGAPALLLRSPGAVGGCCSALGTNFQLSSHALASVTRLSPALLLRSPAQLSLTCARLKSLLSRSRHWQAGLEALKAKPGALALALSFDSSRFDRLQYLVSTLRDGSIRWHVALTMPEADWLAMYPGYKGWWAKRNR